MPKDTWYKNGKNWKYYKPNAMKSYHYHVREIPDGLSYNGERIITFGKHKGSKISSLPTNYLQWLLTWDFGEDILLVVIKELYNRNT